MMFRIVAMAIVVFFACSCDCGASTPHELRFANSDDITTLDPVLSAETTVGLLSQLTMAYLVRYDRSNRPIPELATEIPTKRNGGISADGKTITWHLRRDAVWSDGAPFDAYDVAFTVATIRNPANNVVSRDGFDSIDRVQTPDRYTSVFRLKKPYAAFLPRFFGSPPGNPCILPRHALDSQPTINTAPYNALPIGIGPFRYVSWRRGEAIRMEANPTYFRGMPKLRRIDFEIVADAGTALTRLAAGDVDLLMNVKPVDVARARTIPDATVVRRPSYRFVTLAFNTSTSILRDTIVRRALQLAVDRDELVRKVDGGLGTAQQSFVPSGYVSYRKIALPRFDIARAEAMLARDGWTLGPDGIRRKNGAPLEIDLDTVAGAYPQYVELIRAWWTELGVSLQTKTFDPKFFYQPQTGVVFGGRFDATIYSIQNFPFVYPSLIFACDRIPPNGLNLTRYCDAGLDALMRDYESTYDTERQQSDLASIAQKVSDDVPLIVLTYADNVFVFRSGVERFAPNGITFFDDMMDIDVR